MPTIGPAFEPLPDDPDRSRRRARAARENSRTSSTAAPPTPSAPRSGSAPCSACWPWSRSAWRGGWSCERRALQGQAAGRLGAIVASLALVGVYLAAGGSSYAPAKTQDPCKPRPWRNPEGLQADRRAVLALGARRRRLQARRLAGDPGPGPGHAAVARTLHRAATGSTTPKLAEAIRAGLVRAVDDAEDAGALSPLARRAAARSRPAGSRSTRRSNWSNNARSLLDNVQSFLGPAEGLLEQFLP